MTATTHDRWGIALIRIIVGAVFVAHGLQKLLVFGLDGLSLFMAQSGLPLPMVSAILITVTELAGGAALAAGLFTRWAAVPLAFAMLVATLVVHLPAGFFLPNGAEYTITLLAVTIGLALEGPGAFAVDNLRTTPAIPDRAPVGRRAA